MKANGCAHVNSQIVGFPVREARRAHLEAVSAGDEVREAEVSTSIGEGIGRLSGGWVFDAYGGAGDGCPTGAGDPSVNKAPGFRLREAGSRGERQA